jgi:hypothetical protein
MGEVITLCLLLRHGLLKFVRINMAAVRYPVQSSRAANEAGSLLNSLSGNP